jgi:tetratricopeptide (TPR) repeat protein
MSPSSSTTPANKTTGPSGSGAAPVTGRASVQRTIVTWLLLAVWAALVTFGAISATDPKWLRNLAELGSRSESEAYKHYGDTEFRRHNYAGAITQYLRALQIRSDRVGIRLNLGIAYVESGQLAKGVDALEQVLEGRPSDRISQYANYYLGSASEKTGHKEDALRFYRSALELGAEPGNVHRQIGSICFASGDLERAQEEFEKALAGQTDPLLTYRDLLGRLHDDEVPPDQTAWADGEKARVRSLEDLARYDTEILTRMCESDPDVAKIENHLGFIDYRMGRATEAAAHFQRSLKIWPDNADAKRNLQVIARELQQGGRTVGQEPRGEKGKP